MLRALSFAGTGVLLLVALAAQAQTNPEGARQGNSAPDSASSLATVHGVVKNAVTGEPLPRALVTFNGQSGPAALTDGDGRFEISGVPTGLGILQVARPGFEDAVAGVSGPGIQQQDLRGFTHSIFVIANTPELEFAMRPTNAIHGQIELSTGDPAQNIAVILLEKHIQNGRAMWRTGQATHTNSDGAFRFARLDDGDYVLVTEPAMDTDMVSGVVEAGSAARVTWNGYPAVYYPDAREFSGAARIHVAGGEQAQANLTLTLEAFHQVRATVNTGTTASFNATRLPSGAILAPVGAGGPGPSGTVPALTGIHPAVLDPQGQELPYPAQFNATTRTVQTMLPDGSYTFRISAFRANGTGSRHSTFRVEDFLSGQANFSVAGHPVTKLRVALGPESSNPLQVTVNRTGTQTSQPANHGEVFVEISQAGPRTDGMGTVFAQGAVPGTLETDAMAPGAYWVHITIAPGLCEDSFTAGGAKLAREPLRVGVGGTTAPLTLTLRDDCAKLKISLPGSGIGAGEETAYSVYVVPDFDSTADARPLTLRASSGGQLSVDNLTPGNYHVYTFAAPVDLEYRNPELLSAMPHPGQAVTLSPGSTANLVLEVPAP
jgi:hypothetical protein